MSRRRPLTEPEKRHADWLGMLRPDGLVVSVPVLVDADAYVRQTPEVQEQVRVLCPDDELPGRAAFDQLCADILHWPAARLADAAVLDTFGVALPDLGVVLRPDAALLDRDGKPLIFVAWSPNGLDDAAPETRWPISRQGRFERLLLESQGAATGAGADRGTPIGVHACPTGIRVTYAPRGEAPGSLTFPIVALCAFDGRLLIDALVMLIGRDRLFTVASEHRLLALLRASRQRQEKVTEELAGQVEEALEILVAGFDVANARSKHRLLADYADVDADGVAGVEKFRNGLVTVLLRLVFLLYCEDQGVLPADNPFYLDNYSLAGLAARLQEERVLYPEAMRHRYGAWARLCALFRLVWAGARHRDLTLPARQGELFDPKQHLFLEGRLTESDDGELPAVDDGVVDEVLERLVYLEGQRISYRNLDVEQIGSVYEALMALSLKRAGSLALPLKGGGWLEVADVLEADKPANVVATLTGLKPAELTRRAPTLATFEPTGDPDVDVPTLQTALGTLIRADAEPRKQGQHYLSAGGERRRTGSHYTPSTLTRPIVERTLGPVLDKAAADGAVIPPTAAQILAMKVCDPAMGSGAFLAEACRYLARRLLDAWTREGNIPPGARDGDPLLYARRLVAERCLYGVDKNPFAVQLARLSLWLVTLAKDLPFTFVDHALREGDAVIGLSAAQIGAFSFDGKGGGQMFAYGIRRSIDDAVRARALILQPDLFSWNQKSAVLRDSQNDVHTAKTRANLLIADAWTGGSAKEQKARKARIHPAIDAWFMSNGRERLNTECQGLIDGLDQIPLKPFHWELEFPEVFARENPGFDAVVGNPPFGGKNTILTQGGEPYIRLLQQFHPHANGNADLVSYFFLRAANILHKRGSFGLVATNTIKQGHTRATGLQHLVAAGFSIYDATTDMVWPVGGAAVVVDVVHVHSGSWADKRFLNAAEVEAIGSGLTDGPEDSDPVPLSSNADRAFQGTNVVCVDGFCLSLAEGDAAAAADPSWRAVLQPFIGGEEMNTSPTLTYDRLIIDFKDLSLEEAGAWPAALERVTSRVKPLRDNDKRALYRERWWQFGERRPGLYAAIARQKRCLAASQVSKHHLVTFQPTDRVFGHTLNIFAFDDDYSFAVLQSRVHEAWARHAGLSSTMKTDTRYTVSTCFETFPFPRPTDTQRNAVALAGQQLYEHRSALMLRFNEGMTKIWNRLVDPDEHDPGIVTLRALRDTMDRAVLDAYGWSDLRPEDTAAIVKRLRALNAERAEEERVAEKRANGRGTRR